MKKKVIIKENKVDGYHSTRERCIQSALNYDYVFFIKD